MADAIAGRFTRITCAGSAANRMVDATVRRFRPFSGIARFRVKQKDAEKILTAIKGARALDGSALGLAMILGTPLDRHLALGVPFRDETQIASIGPIIGTDGMPAQIPMGELEKALGQKTLPEPLEARATFDLNSLQPYPLDQDARLSYPSRLAATILTAMASIFPNPRFSPIHFEQTRVIDPGKLWRGATFGAAFDDVQENPATSFMVLFGGNIRQPWGKVKRYFIGGGSTEHDAGLLGVNLSVHLTNLEDRDTLEGREKLLLGTQRFVAALTDSPMLLRPDANAGLLLTVPNDVEPDPDIFGKLNLTGQGTLIKG